MLDERKIKLMTKMSLYEANQGKEDLKISAYYRKDYTSLHTIATILWITVGYACLMMLLILSAYDMLMETMTVGMLVTMGIGIVVCYLLLVIAYAVYTHVTCNQRHQAARARVKRYNRSLVRLLNGYKKKEIRTMKKESR